MSSCECNDDSDSADSAASSGISSSEEQNLLDDDFGPCIDFGAFINEKSRQTEDIGNNSDDSSSSSISTILAGNSIIDCQTPSPTTRDSSFNAILPKKCVKFADEIGKELYTIRVMTEPSDYPPHLSPSILRRYKTVEEDSDECWDSDSSDNGKSKASWTLTFKQPASEYVKFRESLEKNKVALENVVLKNDHHRMSGTIKVVNLSFEKKVFLRLTTDGWKTFSDKVATYQPSNSKLYDTFCFEAEIPWDENENASIEFCICYKGGDQEYWDSNDGTNYRLITEACKYKNYLTQPLAYATTVADIDFNRSPNSMSKHERGPKLGYQANISTSTRLGSFEDTYSMKPSNWTQYASWKNVTNNPYW
uniref:CBM21 domain-containing protein n=1 Tax=Rhabditophanes sp. KR3021 TaxID=114890 RepID=A0AC35U8B4_9BILA